MTTHPSRRRALGAMLAACGLAAAVFVVFPAGGAAASGLLGLTTSTLLPDVGEPTVDDTCLSDPLTSTTLCVSVTSTPMTTTTTAPADPGTDPNPGDEPVTTTTTTAPGSASPPRPGSPGGTDRAPAGGGSDEAVASDPGTSPAIAPWRIEDAFHREAVGADGTWSPGRYHSQAGMRSTADLMAALGGPAAPPDKVAQALKPFPVAGAAHYGDDWGTPRHGPGTLFRTHQGTDIFAAHGTPVLAAATGVVSRMTTTGLLGGISLRVTAPDGTFHYYAHLAGFAPGLHDGATVEMGEVLGYVGNTGNARTTPPHLHFEIHPAGGPAVPPVPYLDRWLADARERVGGPGLATGGRSAIVVAPSDPGGGSALGSRIQPLSSPAAAGSAAPILDVEHAAAARTGSGAQVLAMSLIGAAVWWWATCRPAVTRRRRPAVGARSGVRP